MSAQAASGAGSAASNLLEVSQLCVDFKTENTIVQAVKDVSFQLKPGQTLGLVGESGSGKSVTSLAIMRLIAQPPGQISAGRISYRNQDLLKLTEAEMRRIRGHRISMIFQEPMTSLNPVFKVGYQIAEVLKLHKGLNSKEAWQKAIDLLDQVGIPHPATKIEAYPHEMSGGQRQRVMIAMAIACEPDILIADEPTTALDVTIQLQILELLRKLQDKNGMSMLFITHDLGVVRQIAEDVVVMYRGLKVEEGRTHEIFAQPQHPYTKGLINCRPALESNPRRLATVADFMNDQGQEITPDAKVLERFPKSSRLLKSEQPVVLELRQVSKDFPIQRDLFGRPKLVLHAVKNVSFVLHEGRTLGLVGESGCGKTTLGRTLLRLIEPTSGQILYRNQDITHLGARELRALRRKMQIIFQDPYASLNPRMTIGAALMEPMQIHGLGDTVQDRESKARRLMARVGLEPQMLNRYPHEFSGGQRQRVCIARALAVEPEFIVCDESVSALDVSVQAQILNLLLDLQEELKLTYIFISHDLAVVRFISDEIAVMNQGEIVEFNNAVDIYKQPQNAYTKKLLAAIPP